VAACAAAPAHALIDAALPVLDWVGRATRLSLAGLHVYGGDMVQLSELLALNTVLGLLMTSDCLLGSLMISDCLPHQVLGLLMTSDCLPHQVLGLLMTSDCLPHQVLGLLDL
jgi:hypothetical protein